MNNWNANIGQKLALACTLLFVLTFTWVSSFPTPPSALAGTIDELPFVVAGTNVVDRVAAGTGEQVEGGFEEAVGTVKRNVGEVSGQTEGAAQQAKGKVKQGIGEAKEEVGEASSDLQRKSESLVDSVKDFFDVD